MLFERQAWISRNIGHLCVMRAPGQGEVLDQWEPVGFEGLARAEKSMAYGHPTRWCDGVTVNHQRFLFANV